ncbi:hypothetical protein AAFC00_002626 [Neodothiora populina]|uniref:peptidylprolyl isomerase n=1 Tax=Neodothiora populina TaxID=2781224 RepID=A0ABR3P803_9PEZI
MTAVIRPRVFLDVTIGTEPAGRLTIELFTDKTPKTCENFRQLCTSSDPAASYAASPFHRIIDEFMIQGGDITAGNGTGGKSIYNDGGEFADENLEWRQLDATGLVCMANRGRDTNSSQFFITLEPCPHLNGKHTVFGNLVGGHDVLQRMAKVKVNDDDKPFEPVLVARCGELERKRKPPAINSGSPEKVADRGRKRSDGSSHSPVRKTNGSPRTSDKRKRRQSDNQIDENLRGRPRARSDDESDANTHRDSRSPATIHRRRRSPSPSRVPPDVGGQNNSDNAEADYERRRRRSLPNQYHDEQRRRGSETRDREHSRSRSRDRRSYRRSGQNAWNEPRNHDRRDGTRGGEQRHKGYARRQQDRYRPSMEGRLGGGSSGEGAGGDNESGIKFKGRGSMKYREPDRKW